MASALEHYVNNVRTLTSAGKTRFQRSYLFSAICCCCNLRLNFWFWFSGSFRELVEYLNDSTELLSKNSNILDNVLETLDVQQHSLGVLYILVAKISEIQVNESKLDLQKVDNVMTQQHLFHFRMKIPKQCCRLWRDLSMFAMESKFEMQHKLVSFWASAGSLNELQLFPSF